MSDNFDFYDIILITFFAIILISMIATVAAKIWLTVEGIKIIESMGGFAGIFEKILKLFS